MDADFFVRLAQRGVEQGRIDRIDASAGKRDLAAMTRDVVGSADIDDVKFAARSNSGISTAAALDLFASASRGGGVTVESLRRMVSTWRLNVASSLIATDNRAHGLGLQARGDIQREKFA